MTRDLVIALTLTSAKQCAPRRLAPVSSPSSTANTRARNSGNASANSFARVGRLRGAHASSRAGERVPRSRTFLSLGRVHYVHDSQKKYRFGGTPKPGRRGDRYPIVSHTHVHSSGSNSALA